MALRLIPYLSVICLVVVKYSVSPLVGQKPVEALRTITRTNADNHIRELRYFSLVERAMLLKGGQVLVSA